MRRTYNDGKDVVFVVAGAAKNAKVVWDPAVAVGEGGKFQVRKESVKRPRPPRPARRQHQTRSSRPTNSTSNALSLIYLFISLSPSGADNG